MVKKAEYSPGQWFANYIKNPEEHTSKDGGSRDSVFDGTNRNALWEFYPQKNDRLPSEVRFLIHFRVINNNDKTYIIFDIYFHFK